MKTSLTTRTDNMTSAHLQFCAEFGDLPPKFNEWQSLNSRCSALETLIAQQPWLSPSDALRSIEMAKNRLALGKAYRIVVLGEAGYGKSLLLNILIGRKILPSKDAGALTALATYVHRDVEKNQPESLKIISPAQMDESARKFCGEVLKLAANLQVSVELPTGVERTTREFWERQLNGKAGLQTEEIYRQPRIEYHLRKAEDSANASTGLGLHNVVFVDTPGTGSENADHMTVLHQELLEAQAIIYLAKFPRPDIHAKALAQLLRETVFKDFADEQYKRFAGKVLLVVNKFTNVDPHSPEIRSVVNELRQQIYGTPDGVSFNHDAEPKAHLVELRQAALAQIKMNNGQFSQPQEETDYAGYEGSYRKTVELSGMAVTDPTNIPQALWLDSQVPQFMQALQEFLSTQRLIQMLGEATYHWQHAVTAIKEECSRLLNEHHVNDRLVRNKLERVTYLVRLKNDECKAQLTKDKDELQRNYKRFEDELVQWLDTHASAQARLIDQIYTTINNHLLQQLKTMDDLIFETDDLKRRRKYIDTIWPQVRLRLEKTLLQVVEDTARETLSTYYIDKFNALVNSHELHAAILQKFYGQQYLDGCNFITRLERSEVDFTDHFTNICCWTLVYELERSEQNRPEIQKSLGIQPAPGTTTKAAPFSTVTLAKTEANGGNRGSNRVWNLFQSQTTHASMSDPDKNLVEQFIEHDYSEILERFAHLYQTAFQQVQQLLDTLFINELIRYRDAYMKIVNELHEEHTHHLSSADLKNALFQEYGAVRAEIDKAITVLDQLEQLNTSGFESISTSPGQFADSARSSKADNVALAEANLDVNGNHKMHGLPLPNQSTLVKA